MGWSACGVRREFYGFAHLVETYMLILCLVNENGKKLAYLASTTDSQAITNKKLAQNLASILLNLALLRAALNSASLFVKLRYFRAQPVFVGNLSMLW